MTLLTVLVASKSRAWSDNPKLASCNATTANSAHSVGGGEAPGTPTVIGDASSSVLRLSWFKTEDFLTLDRSTRRNSSFSAWTFLWIAIRAAKRRRRSSPPGGGGGGGVTPPPPGGVTPPGPGPTGAFRRNLITAATNITVITATAAIQPFRVFFARRRSSTCRCKPSRIPSRFVRSRARRADLGSSLRHSSILTCA